MNIHRTLLTLLISTVAASAATIGITPSTTTTTSGPVSLNVTVTDVSSLYGFQFDVVYAPASLAATSVTETGYFATNGVFFAPGTINNSTGRITNVADALSGATPGFFGSGNLTTVNFNVLASATSAVTL